MGELPLTGPQNQWGRILAPISPLPDLEDKDNDDTTSEAWLPLKGVNASKGHGTESDTEHQDPLDTLRWTVLPSGLGQVYPVSSQIVNHDQTGLSERIECLGHKGVARPCHIHSCQALLDQLVGGQRGMKRK